MEKTQVVEKEWITFFRHIGPKSEEIADLLEEHKADLEKRFNVVTVFASEADDIQLLVGHMPYIGEKEIRWFINSFCAVPPD